MIKKVSTIASTLHHFNLNELSLKKFREIVNYNIPKTENLKQMIF